MTIASVPRLVEMVRECGLLSAAQLVELDQLQGQFAETKALMAELGQRGWVTRYQQEQFLAGRHVDLLVGQYILLEPLGEGGMAQVFKAKHLDTGEIAALKVIRKDHWMDSKVVRRFRREIEAVSKLSHPNLVTASGSQEQPSCHFLAMEYCQGVNLDRIIAAQGQLPLAPACDYIRQAALGLQHIHERGLIHRDIKPGNLLIIPPSAEAAAARRVHGHWGTVKILDLGFVLLQRPGLEEGQTQLTRKGFLLGTVDYTAPEQAADPHNVDIRADLYSLGCAFYEMLAGRLPYLGSNPFKKLHQHQTAEPPPLETLRHDLPPDVVHVVKKLMAKSPADRYALPSDLAEEMTRIVDQLPEAAMPWDWKPPTTPRPRVSAGSSLLEDGRRRFVKSLVLALALTLVILTLLRFLG